MRVLITDTGSQQGYDVCRILAEHGIEHQGMGPEQINNADVCAADSYPADYRPDAVMHGMAYTEMNQDDLKKVCCVAANEGGRWSRRTMRKTDTADLPSLLFEMVTTKKCGPYNDTYEDVYSLAKYTQGPFRQAERKTISNVIPVSEYPTPAVGSSHSRRSKALIDDAGSTGRPSCHGTLRCCVKGELL